MFSIFRTQTAMSPLQSAWEHYDDELRQEILEASCRIDQQLVREPKRQGESREEGTRILIESPLAVVFDVDESKKLVRITRAWAFRTRSNRRQVDQ